MVAYLPAPIRSIESRSNDKESEQSDGELEWVFRWLIKPNSLKKFVMHLCRTVPLFSHSFQEMVMYWMEDQMSLSNGLSSQNSLKKIHNALLQNLSTVFIFILRCGDQLTLMKDRMSLSDGLSSQNSLKKVRDATLQNLSIVSTFISRCGDWSILMENRMSSSDGLSSQLIKEDSWHIFCRTFPLFSHSYQNMATKWGSKRTPRGG